MFLHQSLCAIAIVVIFLLPFCGWQWFIANCSLKNLAKLLYVCPLQMLQEESGSDNEDNAGMICILVYSES